jgi:uncharacterized protein (TIGR02466 family)
MSSSNQPTGGPPGLERQIAQAYATPIGRFRIPDAAELNRGLRRLILEKEAVEPSDDFANVGGWHSRMDLWEWPSPEIGALKGWIMEAVRHMMAVAAEGSVPAGRVAVRAWANVARRGHFHRVHNHPAAVWSGVYYVDAGAEAPGHRLSGVLELCDPRPFTEMVVSPGNPWGKRVVFPPEAGMMVLFPSWIYHFVNPHFGDGERISIAFNVQWQEGGPPRPAMQ